MRWLALALLVACGDDSSGDPGPTPEGCQDDTESKEYSCTCTKCAAGSGCQTGPYCKQTYTTTKRCCEDSGCETVATSKSACR
jgi:hypothetical protein